MINTSEIIDGVLAREGSEFTDRPDDKGGPTCCGITLEAYQQYSYPIEVTVEDLRKLTPAMARSVYLHQYIEAPGFGAIRDAGLQTLMVDTGVQHGVTEASKMLQRAAEISPIDGRIGAKSLQIINTGDSHKFQVLVCAARMRLYGALISHDPHLQVARAAGFNLQADNALGWANRLAYFVESAV